MRTQRPLALAAKATFEHIRKNILETFTAANERSACVCRCRKLIAIEASIVPVRFDTLLAFSLAKLFWQQTNLSFEDGREMPVVSIATSIANLHNGEICVAKQLLSVS